MRAAVVRQPGATPVLEQFTDPQPGPGLVLRNKLLTLVGHSLFATPAEVRRSAYAQLAGHAIDGKFTVDLERTRLEDISGTWEHLKTGASRKLVVAP